MMRKSIQNLLKSNRLNHILKRTFLDDEKKISEVNNLTSDI